MDTERIGEKLFGWWIWLGFFIFIGLGGFFAIWFIVKGIFFYILSFENNSSLSLILAAIIPPFVLYKSCRFWWNVMFVEILIPFFKNNELDYALISNAIFNNDNMLWLILIPIIIFIVTAVSNSNNLTDGLDGLSAGSSAIIVFTLGVFAWTSGNIIFSDYLNIMYIPRVGEITIFIASLLGSLVGFLWYNTYPASIFMGDTGSLTVGGLIAVISILIRKELMIPLLCGVFLIEAISVILQVGYFKITKKRLGHGKRIFLMSPIHHHYQKAGYHESKIVSRFWIIGIFLALLTILTLKIR